MLAIISLSTFILFFYCVTNIIYCFIFHSLALFVTKIWFFMIFMIRISICVFDVEATVIFIIRMIIAWRLLRNLLYDYLLGLILKVSYYYYLVRVLVIDILLLFMCCIFIINYYIFSRFSVIIFIHLF